MNPSAERLIEHLKHSPTPYHAVEEAAATLCAAGFTELYESDVWKLQPGGKYFVRRGGAALIAFARGGEEGGIRIVASHVDSPALHLKGTKTAVCGGCTKLNVEPYGGGLYYSWLDRPLCLAGRITVLDRATNTLKTRTVQSPHRLVIPGLAIHYNRDANRALSLNAQTDLQPIAALCRDFVLSLTDDAEEQLAADLMLVSAAEPCVVGLDDALLHAPRLDDQLSVFASLSALCDTPVGRGTAMICLFDREEIGSRGRTGAGGDFLGCVLHRICEAQNKDYDSAIADAFLVSCDGVHAVHPNHPELSDPVNAPTLGAGVVIKHHAGGNYTTDAESAGVFRALLQQAGVPHADFHMRSDLPCGSTLGVILQSRFSMRSVDIGVAQLAMHSTGETVALRDYDALLSALSAFCRTDLRFDRAGGVTLCAD